MYAIGKFVFEDQLTHDNPREFKIFLNKFKQKFRVSAKISTQNSPTLYAALVSSKYQLLQSTLDQMSDYCDESGLGRLSHEEVIIEDFEDFSDNN